MKNRLKRIVVVFVTGVMVLGSSMNVFAREYTVSQGNLTGEEPEGVTMISYDDMTINYQYDQNGNVIVKHENSSYYSSTIYYEYNSEGKVVKEIGESDSSTEWSTYEYQGNVVIKQSANSYHPDNITTVTYTYDDMGNLLQEYEKSDYFSRKKDYVYDNNGNLLQEYVDGYLDCTYTYDAQGRKTSETADVYNNIFYYTYDSNNRVSQIDGDERHVEITYNQYGDKLQEKVNFIERSSEGGGWYEMIYDYRYVYDEYGRILKEEQVSRDTGAVYYSASYAY